MIIITGGAGFIGSALIWNLNSRGIDDILVVDRLGKGDKWKNLANLKFRDYIDKAELLSRLHKNYFSAPITAILHMGACSATTEQDADYLIANNYRYSVDLALWAIANNVRFIYASSAATYGDGSRGYNDNPKQISSLCPLNMYGYSKQLFDNFIVQKKLLNKIVGLKFFNVFGPNEYHKGDMRSILHKFFPDALAGKTIRLFQSHKKNCAHGMQRRDFIYIKDIVSIVDFFLINKNTNGIFNAGTGQSSSFLELITSLYKALNKKPKIKFRPMPNSLRNHYQYFTEANTDNLRIAGYKKQFTPLSEAVKDYVKNYLLTPNPYLTN